MSFCQKNFASVSLASTTLSLPSFINPFKSFLFETTKNSFVILPFLSKVGKYFWWYCMVIIKISLGIFKNFLSNWQTRTLGWSIKSTTSSNSFGFWSITIFFFFKSKWNFFSIIFFFSTGSIIIFFFLKKFLYFLKSENFIFFSSKSLSTKVKLDDWIWWNLNINVFLLNIAKIDFSGLPQFKPKSPQRIDFFHWILFNIFGTNSSNNS